MLEGVKRFNKGRPLQGSWGLAHGDGWPVGEDGAVASAHRKTELS